MLISTINVNKNIICKCKFSSITRHKILLVESIHIQISFFVCVLVNPV